MKLTTKAIAKIAALAGVDASLVTVESLNEREKKADDMIGGGFAIAHECLVVRLAHATVHGDHSGIAARYAAASAPVRKAMGVWLPQCSPLIVDGGKIVKSREPDAPAYNVEWAKLNPLISAKPPKQDADAFALAQLRDYLRKKATGKNITAEAKKTSERLARLVEDELAAMGEGRESAAIEAGNQEKRIEGDRAANAVTQQRMDGKGE